MDELWRKSWENPGDRLHERPIFQGACDSRRRRRSRQHCQQLGDFLRVAGGVGSDATAKAVDGRAEPVQLDVVDDEEPVVEVVGVGDGEPLVLTVELRDFGLCRLAAIFADKANLYARPLLRKDLQRDRIRIRVDEYNLRLPLR